MLLFSLGSRPAFLPSRPYFGVCVPVAVFLSTDTSLCSPIHPTQAVCLSVARRPDRAADVSPLLAKLGNQQEDLR